VLVLARRNQSEAAAGLIGGQESHFARGVAGRFEDEELAVARAARTDVEALVGFFQHQNMAGGLLDAIVTPELVLALLLLVLHCVKQRAIVGGPDDRTDALNMARKIGSG
jgi:hypothetical protein